MAKIVYSARAIAHLERAFESLAAHDVSAGVAAGSAIRAAVELPADHRLIGRRVTNDYRELVISYGRTGYVAMYRFRPLHDEIRILAIRHQRELDYPE